MRLNIWLDERNYRRMVSLAGEHFADGANTQNTVFCLFEPNAPGIRADEFPTDASVYFGTRPGNRMPVCCSVAYQPDDPGKVEVGDATAKVRQLSYEDIAATLTARRVADTRGEVPSKELIERMVWEFQNSQDARSFAAVMNALADHHPAHDVEGAPILPRMPDLMQGLNLAAADSRALIVVVEDPRPTATATAPSDEPDGPSGGGLDAQRLARLAFEPGLAGRFHSVRLTRAEWRAARDRGQVTANRAKPGGPGLYVVAPEPYGLAGRVQTALETDLAPAALRDELLAALERFSSDWRKLDRGTHLEQGSRRGIVWTEYDPWTDQVGPIATWTPRSGIALRSQRRYLAQLLKSRGQEFGQVAATLGIKAEQAEVEAEELQRLIDHLSTLPTVQQRKRIAKLLAAIGIDESAACALVQLPATTELTHEHAKAMIEALQALRDDERAATVVPSDSH